MSGGSQRALFREEALAAYRSGLEAHEPQEDVRLPRWPLVTLGIIAGLVLMAVGLLPVPSFVTGTALGARDSALTVVVPDVSDLSLRARTVTSAKPGEDSWEGEVVDEDVVRDQDALVGTGLPEQTPLPTTVLTVRPTGPSTRQEAPPPLARVTIRVAERPLLQRVVTGEWLR